MFFWLAAAALTIIACMAVLAPLVRASVQTSDGYDVEVYKDQLAEVERDASRGLIAPEQAELARAEVARRLLKADQSRGADAVAAAAGNRLRMIGLASVLAIPVIAWGGYALIGSAGLPGEPLAARLERNPAESSVEELVARAEKHLAENPADARGWSVLAPIYLRQGRFGDARKAFENAIRLSGSSAALQSGLGEAIVAEAGGVVTTDAAAAFRAALAVEPTEEKSRYFLAVAMAQEGKLAQAKQSFEAMGAGLDANSPWKGVIDAAIAETVARMDAPAQPGPDADTVAAANEMSDDERKQMIEGMVATLDARLRENPADIDGWERLIRSYVVLGRQDDARGALERAVEGLKGDADNLARVKDFAAGLGIGSGG